MACLVSRPQAPSDSEPRMTAWVSGIPYLLAWLPGVFATLYLKYAIIRRFELDQPGIKLRMRNMGFLGPLSLYRRDILFAFLLIPSGVLVLASLLPRRWRAPIVSIFTILCAVIFYSDYVCFSAVGRLLSFSLARDALAWGQKDPGSVRAYLVLRRVLATTALILCVVVVCWWGARRSKVIIENPNEERRRRRAALVVASTVTALTAILWVPRAHATPYHESIFVTTLKSLVDWRDRPESEFSPLSPPELARAYRGFTNAPSPKTDSRYWGKAQGSDLVFFVFETGPFRFMPMDGNLDDFPNSRRLRERSFVALQHNTTYPDTDRGVFSLFSSWYPSSLANFSVQQHINLNVPGIMRTLAARRYSTAVFNPFIYRRLDDRALQLLGFQRRLVANTFAGIVPMGVEERWSLDLNTLTVLTQDMDRWETQGQRFAVAFLPECGHFPLPSRSPDGQPETVVQRGRAVMARQDAFLGQLVRLLEAHPRLDQTLIVVTSDHGVRGSVEDPSLPIGTTDQYSFHFPLLIYAPQALNHPETVPWIASHIDVAPSLLDLLGIERERDPEQGSPIWDSRLQQRTTFYFANHYFGADAYYSNGQFFMRSAVFDTVYQNGRLHFAASHVVPPTSPRSEVTATIRHMVGLQETWAEKLGQPIAKDEREKVANHR